MARTRKKTPSRHERKNGSLKRHVVWTECELEELNRRGLVASEIDCLLRSFWRKKMKKQRMKIKSMKQKKASCEQEERKMKETHSPMLAPVGAEQDMII